ncbi:Pkinase domain-containing protein [Cephalotus follicularis]|uniref:Pkinase domain-containing protein n=1 Tax=Cephalotus follicularis TaxID=3775 RepID=A0A1Q3B4D9_CEPFO|nr:Pkinase domain-containing protein [Cephalotus follicularis]
MCKSKMAIKASVPTRRSQSSSTATTTKSSSFSNRYTSTSSSSTSSSTTYTKASTSSSVSTLSSLRDSLPENPHIYDISEIRSATNNFLAKRHNNNSSIASWRCTLRGRSTVIFQRKFRRKIHTDQLKEMLSIICRNHHVSIVKLLGASVSGDHIYLVYDHVQGANLAECLRNPRNPNFTVLSTWISRMQVAADLAHGLDYIHNSAGFNLVHNHIKNSSIIVTEPHFNARICHFGTAQLCGEIRDDDKDGDDGDNENNSSKVNRSDSGITQFEGVRGYMAPEFMVSGVPSQKADVYAFGVLVLELLSGEEPLKYKLDKIRGDYVRTSLIETARDAIQGGGGGGGGHGRLRTWVDRRLKDSFPVEVAEKLTRLALECVHSEADQRPNMGRVVGKISKLYLESKFWSDNIKIPAGVSVSLAPR